MRFNHIFSFHTFVLFSLVSVALNGCSPTTSPIPGWCEGGSGVFTPEDVKCYLDSPNPSQIHSTDEEFIVLLIDSQTIADWAGAAIIFHVPTASMLVFDRFGDIDPQASVFSSRAGLAAISKLAQDPERMAELKQQVMQRWQNTPSKQPEIRLSTAWQDGQTTFFLIAVAGLAVDDTRFYCPSQLWTIGTSTIEIASECIAHEAGAPVNRIFIESMIIQGDTEQGVQVALDSVMSNKVQVREGETAQETAVYEAVLQRLANPPYIVRGETAPELDDSIEQLTTVPEVLQDYQVANQTPFSLHLLFQNSTEYFVQPSEVVSRDYLSASESQQACVHFRSAYPGLGGVVTLSRIGYGDDGTQALVYLLLECGPTDRSAAYFTSTHADDGWVVTEEIPISNP